MNVVQGFESRSRIIEQQYTLVIPEPHRLECISPLHHLSSSISANQESHLSLKSRKIFVDINKLGLSELN